MTIEFVGFVVVVREINTAEFLASLESSATMGLDDLNYDSVWDNSEVTEEEEVVEE